MKKPRFLKKGDVILVVAVAVALLLFWGVSRFLYPPAENGVAEITVNGKPHGTYPLDKEVSFTVQDENGGYNRVEIKNGEVRIADADCPDRLCVRQGAISHKGETIVCLPHGLIITVCDGANGDVDFITG